MAISNTISNAISTNIYKKGLLQIILIIYLVVLSFAYGVATILNLVVGPTELKFTYQMLFFLIAAGLNINVIFFIYYVSSGRANTLRYERTNLVHSLFTLVVIGFYLFFWFNGFVLSDFIPLGALLVFTAGFLLHDTVGSFLKYRSFLNRASGFVILGCQFIFVATLLPTLMMLRVIVVTPFEDISFPHVALNLLYLAFIAFNNLRLMNAKQRVDEREFNVRQISLILLSMVLLVVTHATFNLPLRLSYLFLGILLAIIYVINFFPTKAKQNLMIVTLVAYIGFAIIDLVDAGAMSFQFTLLGHDVDLTQLGLAGALLTAVGRYLKEILSGRKMAKLIKGPGLLSVSNNMSFEDIEFALKDLKDKDTDLKLYSNLVSFAVRNGDPAEAKRLLPSVPDRFRSVLDIYVMCSEHEDQLISPVDEREEVKFKSKVEQLINRTIDPDNAAVFSLLPTNSVTKPYVDERHLQNKIEKSTPQTPFFQFVRRYESYARYGLIGLFVLYFVLPSEVRELIPARKILDGYHELRRVYTLNTANIKMNLLCSFNLIDDAHQSIAFGTYYALRDYGDETNAGWFLTTIHAAVPTQNSFWEMGNVHYSNEDFTQAAHFYEIVIDSFKVRDETLFHDLCQSYLRIGSHEKLTERVSSGIHPGCQECSVLLGLGCYYAGNNKRAKELLLSGVDRLDPASDLEAYYVLGKIYMAEDSLELAEVYFSRDPKNSRRREVVQFLASRKREHGDASESFDLLLAYVRYSIINECDVDAEVASQLDSTVQELNSAKRLKQASLPAIYAMCWYIKKDYHQTFEFANRAKNLGFFMEEMDTLLSRTKGR
jgi:hypothetical protein